MHGSIALSYWRHTGRLRPPLIVMNSDHGASCPCSVPAHLTQLLAAHSPLFNMAATEDSTLVLGRGGGNGAAADPMLTLGRLKYELSEEQPVPVLATLLESWAAHDLRDHLGFPRLILQFS